MINSILLECAHCAIHEMPKRSKQAFVPGGGMDPAAAGGMPPGGAPPMDPAMAGAAPPMDPAMAGAPPMDPAAAGMAPPPPPAPPAPAVDPMAAGAPMSAEQFRTILREEMGGGAGGKPKGQSKPDMTQMMPYLTSVYRLLINLHSAMNIPISPEALAEGPMPAAGEAAGGESGGGSSASGGESKQASKRVDDQPTQAALEWPHILLEAARLAEQERASGTV